MSNDAIEYIEGKSKETLPKVTAEDLIEFSEGSQVTKENSNDKD